MGSSNRHASPGAQAPRLRAWKDAAGYCMNRSSRTISLTMVTERCIIIVSSGGGKGWGGFSYPKSSAVANPILSMLRKRRASRPQCGGVL
jgi:hypothetical protein